LFLINLFLALYLKNNILALEMHLGHKSIVNLIIRNLHTNIFNRNPKKNICNSNSLQY